jgi:hypothetical protein
MTAQEWQDLTYYLTAKGCNLVYYPQTDSDGLFVDFRYLLVEYLGAFYYMESGDWKFTVTPYVKCSPYERKQAAYPYSVNSTEELIKYMNECVIKPLGKVSKGRIFLTEFYRLRNGHTDLWYLENELAGNREKEILANLKLITMQRNTNDYCVLRFHSTNGDWFDFETKSRRITG